MGKTIGELVGLKKGKKEDKKSRISSVAGVVNSDDFVDRRLRDKNGRK